jgi:hypothetical protein
VEHPHNSLAPIPDNVIHALPNTVAIVHRDIAAAVEDSYHYNQTILADLTMDDYQEFEEYAAASVKRCNYDV